MPTHERPYPNDDVPFVNGIHGSKGIDYGEMGALCAAGAIRIGDGIPQFINDWDTLLLAYANYKCDHGSKIADLFKTWGIPEHHQRWFNDSRSRFRIMNFMAGVTDE